ncbi:MAG: IS1182 family transposase [Bacteroidia bacterium]
MQSTTKVVFKDYTPNQIELLPQSLEELIKPNHPVRIVNQVIDQISIAPLVQAYKGGGSSSYHPRMMLKVLVYGYLSNIYSSRKIESALEESIHFMWLAGNNKPDHNSINRFRSERLGKALKTIFTEIVQLLAAEGLVDIKTVYTDGTKIEANANRYSFVWSKNVSNNRERIKKQIDELWHYAQQVAQDELADTAPLEYDPANAEQVAAAVAQIDMVLSKKKIDKKVRQKLTYARNNFAANTAKANEQAAIVAAGKEKRSSYSKTDHDATFMRMKEDHMKNGQLKPAYNLQISSNNRYIVNYSLHQTTADTRTFIAHIEQYRQLYQQVPHTITADAGYGSEENYAYLEGKQIKGFVKYNHFHLEQRSPQKQNPFAQNNLPYDELSDSFTCPAEKQLYNTGTYQTSNESGYKQVITRYESQSCTECSLKEQCHKAKTNRIIEVNHQLRIYKAQAKANLNSEEGIKHRKQRPADVEPVFAQIKHNKAFKRFMLRGIAKVEIEAGLIAIANNLARKAAA